MSSAMMPNVSEIMEFSHITDIDKNDRKKIIKNIDSWY